MKTIDIVVPCYNEQEVIAAYYEETSKHVAAINNYSFRYIFVTVSYTHLRAHET